MLMEILEFFGIKKLPFGMKRLPPVLLPFTIPIVGLFLIIGIAALVTTWIGYVFYWLFGFWQCHHCKKHYWVTEDRKTTEKTVDPRFKDTKKVHYCDSCTVAKVLTDDDAPKRLGSPPNSSSSVVRP